MSEQSKKDWERPWTTKEIVEHADNWNLACDAALLNTLKAFGDRILKKAEDVNNKIENLNENLSKIHLQVDLARNEFSSLRNTQFVECRVYEDDETLLSENARDEGENNLPEEETIEDFREVVALGLEILDEYYDKVNVTVSDSEGEDEDGPSYVFRRKDPYIHRRLPLVIGSDEWHKKWHVGLEETDSENENSSEKLSDSENEEDNFSQNKDHSDVSSELSNLSGLNNSKQRAVVVPTANITQQDLLASASGSDVSAEPTPKTLSFAEQLAAKLGSVIKETGAPVEEPQVNRRPIQKQPSDFGALFSNEPPPLDDMVEKESHGIFSGGKGLFDDEDEDDLWNPGKTVSSSTKKISTDGRKSEFDKLNQGKGLFDDDSDDGIFASSNSYGFAQQNKQPYLQSNKPAVPVFDEEPPLFEEDTNTGEKKKPAGAVSLFGKSDLFHGQNIGKILKQRRVSSSEDSNEEEPKFTPKPETKSSLANVNTHDKATNENIQNKNSAKQTISSVPQRKDSQEKKSILFDDDIFDDDLFSSTVKKSSSGLFEKSVLFSDDDETVEPFPSRKSSTNENTIKSGTKSDLLSPETPDTEYSFRKNSKSNISSLFGDTGNNDDNIFMSRDSKKTYKEEDYIQQENKDKFYNEIVHTKPELKLFEDDLEDVDDLFSGTSEKKDDVKTKKSKSFLFDDDEDNDFNIFMAKSDNISSIKDEANDIKIEKTSTKIEEFSDRDQTKKSTKPKINLFDDNLDDMDDLFSQLSKKDDVSDNSNIGKSHNSAKTLELSNESSSFNASILTDSNKKIEDTSDKKHDEINAIKEEEISEKFQEIEPKEIPIIAPKPVVKSDFMEKPVTAQKPFIKIDAAKKPAIVQKPDVQSDSYQKSEATQKSNLMSDSSEKPVTATEKTYVPKVIEMEKEIKKPDPKIDNSKYNSPTEDMRKLEALTEDELMEKEIKKDELKDGKSEKYPREDKYGTVPKISITEEPINIKEDIDIFTDTLVDRNSPKIETDKYKNSPNVLNVNFMDSIPPLDDDWDNYSDNTFDDMEPGNDGFQSQPSSLFDSEPPSLFFDDINAFPEDMTKDRSGESLSEKIPPEVFNSSSFANDNGQAKDNQKIDSNIDANLDIESDKNFNVEIGDSQSFTACKIDDNSNKLIKGDEEKSSNTFSDTSKLSDKKFSFLGDSSENDKTKTVGKPKPLQKPKVRTEKANDDEVKIKQQISNDKPDNKKNIETSTLFDTQATPISIEENSDSLFRDKDQTDFLSLNMKHTDYDDNKINENIINDKNSKKSVSFDNLKENEIRADELGGTDSDDNMQSNISKITEKLQQISNKNEERTKPLVIPRKLSHNLNINVGALLPGSALPKIERGRTSDENENLSKSLPASRLSLNEEFVPAIPKTIVRVSSEETPTTTENKLEKSVSLDGGTDIEILQSITKDRVRIPVKRRPSSRRARQKSLRDSYSDFRLDDPIPDSAISSEHDEQVVVDKLTIEQISQNDKLTVGPEEQTITREDNFSNESLERKMPKEINVSEDESEDLFRSIEKDIKNVNKANIISTKKKELFDDENEELFEETSAKLTKKTDSLFLDDDNDLFGNIKHVSEEKHKTGIDTSLRIEEKKIENELFEDQSGYENISHKKPGADKKSTKDNLFDSSDEDDIFKSAAKQTKSGKDVKPKDDSSISIIGRIATKTDTTSLKDASTKSKPDSLFDFSDDDDFLENFASGKDNAKAKDDNNSGKAKSNSLFDDIDDDDIFGTSGAENKTKQDVKPSVINKKPPKSTSLRKLGNIEGEEDPLSALLK